MKAKQHRLRSSVTDSLFVPAVRFSTVGRRAFPVAGARIWNDLSSDVTSSPLLFTQTENTLISLFVPGTIILTASPLHLIKSNQSQKNLYMYSAVYTTDSEALGRRIKWGRRNDTDKF